VPKLKAKPIKKTKKVGKTFVVTQAPEDDSAVKVAEISAVKVEMVKKNKL